MTAAEENAKLRQEIWLELEQAAADRLHPWRTPVLATVGDDGMPSARTVVLRKVDSAHRLLQIYTDARSPKVEQLNRSGRAMLVFWNQATGWQLRTACHSSVLARGAEVQRVWREIADTAAAADYLSLSAPGSPLTSADSQMGGSHHLAIVNLTVQAIDWLALSEHGHRRARLTADSCEWLVP